jgi:SAM-dependent methyltransferase
MGSLSTSAERQVTGIFNATVAGWCIPAAWELGLLDHLRNNQRLHVESFARKHDLDVASTEGLVTSLVVVDVLRRDGDDVVPGSLFDEAYRTKSLFHWMTLGSGTLFSKMQYVLRNENRKGDFYTRDPAAIAYACRDINTEHFEPAFEAAMRGIDYDAKRVVDLGCGSGERLMQLLDRFPGATALGIDIAGPALDVAAKDGAARGYGDRLSFTLGDACAMEYRPEFADVDLLTCFMMGHDFWPRRNCVQSLQALRKAFPKVRRFLLGDSTRMLLGKQGADRARAEAHVPIFTLGFELGHAMMDTYIPTMEEWEGVFGDGGWRCVRKHVVNTHTESVVFELEHV